MPLSELNGKRFNEANARTVLADQGMQPTFDNVQRLIKASADTSGDGTIGIDEMQSAVSRMVLGDGGAPVQQPGFEPTTPIQQMLSETAIPRDIANIYSFTLSPNNEKLTIDPPQLIAPRRGATRGAFTAEASARGGKIISLEGGPFKNAKWVRSSFRDLVKDPAQLTELKEKHNYGLDTQRDLLVVNGYADESPTLFAFSLKADNRGLVAVCSEVTVLDFTADGGGGQVMIRKPVIYVYPETKTEVRVEVALDGQFVAQYPKPDKDSGWSMIATPDGTLFDPKTERRYSYLFWEGTNNRPFELDREQSACVASADCELFLEKACGRFGLNDKERTDFISYWLPHLEQNAFSVIQFLSEETYERYAKMTVTPTPDTVIRMFMIFQASETKVPTGNPELTLQLRKGYTVVEWGGANLDERV